MPAGGFERLIEFLTVHPNDRMARRIAMAGEAEPANTDLAYPKRLGLPPLSELGADLLETSAWTRVFVLTRPVLFVALYAFVFHIGLWPLALVVIPIIYLTTGAALHDLLHKTLGLPERLHGVLLALMGGLILESGHTLQATHQVHHRKLHTSADPEGYVDRYGNLRTLGEGLFCKHYLACWVMRNRPNVRRWVIAEGMWAQVAILSGVLLALRFPVFGVYIAATVMGSWLFPLVGVKLVHRDPGRDVLQGTKTFRGVVVSRFGCGLSYHLEHHLYPRVPGHQLRHLSERLGERLHEAGAVPTQAV